MDENDVPENFRNAVGGVRRDDLQLPGSRAYEVEQAPGTKRCSGLCAQDKADTSSRLAVRK